MHISLGNIGVAKNCLRNPKKFNIKYAYCNCFSVRIFILLRFSSFLHFIKKSDKFSTLTQTKQSYPIIAILRSIIEHSQYNAHDTSTIT